MSCETETTTINEREYSVTQWPAKKAILTKFKLVKTFGASLAILAGQASGEDSDDAKALSNGLSTLFNHSSPDELLSLMTECIIGIACDGKRITESGFDELFSGDNLMDSYKVFIFVLKVNYGNLMKGQLADRFLAKMKESM